MPFSGLALSCLLPIAFKMQFKLLSITSKSVHDLAPQAFRPSPTSTPCLSLSSRRIRRFRAPQTLQAVARLLVSRMLGNPLLASSHSLFLLGVASLGKLPLTPRLNLMPIPVTEQPSRYVTPVPHTPVGAGLHVPAVGIVSDIKYHFTYIKNCKGNHPTISAYLPPYPAICSLFFSPSIFVYLVRKTVLEMVGLSFVHSSNIY